MARKQKYLLRPEESEVSIPEVWQKQQEEFESAQAVSAVGDSSLVH
jgi:hypothetical protein